MRIALPILVLSVALAGFVEMPQAGASKHKRPGLKARVAKVTAKLKPVRHAALRTLANKFMPKVIKADALRILHSYRAAPIATQKLLTRGLKTVGKSITRLRNDKRKWVQVPPNFQTMFAGIFSELANEGFVPLNSSSIRWEKADGSADLVFHGAGNSIVGSRLDLSVTGAYSLAFEVTEGGFELLYTGDRKMTSTSASETHDFSWVKHFPTFKTQTNPMAKFVKGITQGKRQIRASFNSKGEFVKFLPPHH